MKMDALSRWEDKDDWEVADWVFQLTEERWGPHTVDRFADERNSKYKNWNSKYWRIGREQRTLSYRTGAKTTTGWCH
jgi:hypothetical protein